MPLQFVHPHISFKKVRFYQLLLGNWACALPPLVPSLKDWWPNPKKGGSQVEVEVNFKFLIRSSVLMVRYPWSSLFNFFFARCKQHFFATLFWQEIRITLQSDRCGCVSLLTVSVAAWDWNEPNKVLHQLVVSGASVAQDDCSSLIK